MTSGENKQIKKKSSAPALSKGLDILELLASRGEDVSFSEIRSYLKIPSTSLQRFLATLQKKGYLRQNPENSKYQLGLKLMTFVNALLSRLDLRTIARPFIQKLMAKSGETVELAILNENEILYIDKYETPESIRLVVQVGSRYATLHPTAVGKVFLAYMSEEKFEQIIKERGLKKYTENTVTDVDKLKKELEKICSSGYAFDDQEVRLGVRRIAAPIFDHSDRLTGVVGIAGPTFRIKKGRLGDLAMMVKQTAKEISRELGRKSEEN